MGTTIKDIFSIRVLKIWIWGGFVGFLFGVTLGRGVEANKVYKDCRIMGSVRVGDAAFKCEQFSKAVLLMPEGVGKNDSKTNK